jgi:F-type H+-transporting ATPase subunit gamma
MATLIALKRRIQAASNVSKTTKAMQMIAASKLKKSQEATFSTRPYVEKLHELTQNIIRKVEKKSFSHPYISNENGTGKELLIILAPDKGLCGGLVSNLLREFFRYQKEHGNSYYIPVGKKIEGKVAHLSDQVIATFHMGTTTPRFDAVYPLLQLIEEYYAGGKVDKVKVLYTHFKSFFSQTATISQLLPLEIHIPEDALADNSDTYVFEPSSAEILPSLLKHHLEMSLYHMMLESFLSEQASRMMAMQNATENANDIIEALRLEYNKNRQAKITSELLDITGAGIAAGA